MNTRQTSEELPYSTSLKEKYKLQFKEIHHLDKGDVAIAVSAALLGALIEVCMIEIPHGTHEGTKAGILPDKVRKGFEKILPEDKMNRLANSSICKVPFDAQHNIYTTVDVDGLSPQYHRLLSLGHDPILGLYFGTKDILNGTMTTIDKSGHIVTQIMEGCTDRTEANIFSAIAKLILHYKSDINTSMGLPAPFMALFNLLQVGNIGDKDQTIAELVQGMYYEGYDFIHFCSMSIPLMIVEVIIRLGYFLKRKSEGYSTRESIPYSTNRNKHPKLATMLFIGHTGVTAANAVKVVFSKNPLAINYPEWIAFLRYLIPQLKWCLFSKRNTMDKYIKEMIEKELNGISQQADIPTQESIVYRIAIE